MEGRTLSFSAETIKERKRIIHIMMVMLPLIMVFSMYFFLVQTGTRQLSLSPFIIVMAIMIPVIVIEVLIVSRVMFKKISEMKLVVLNDMLMRVGGKSKEEIVYKDISNVCAKRDKKNKISYIKVVFGKKTVVLSGFEDMETVLNYLKENINSDVIVNEANIRLDGNSPLMIIITMIVTAIVIIGMLKLDDNVFDIFILFFPFAFGLFFIALKPISKNGGTRFRKFEIILSVIFFVGGILILVGNLLK